MRTVLHILTRPADDLTQELIARQRALSETAVEVFDLTHPEADHEQVLERLFAADSIEVW